MDFEFYHIISDTTLQELVSTPLAIFGGFKDNTAALLAYSSNVDESSVNDTYGAAIGVELISSESKSNFDRIVEEYSKTELETEVVKIKSRQITLIKAGTVLLLPKGSIDMELTILTGRNLFVKDIASFPAFYGTYLDLLKNSGFTPIFHSSTKDNDIDIREYRISVWVWSRAYSQDGTTLLDITKYIEQCSTNVNGTQNSFHIVLQAIDNKGVEVGDEMFNRVNIDSITQISDKLPISWFKKILQQNDIFFIRFEQLTLETTKDRISDSGIEVSASNLPGKCFDMIGLADRVNGWFNANSTDMKVEITGRDLTKLLVEDGSYFFPLLFTENSEALFFNTQDDSRWFKRTFIKNAFDYLFLYKVQSIRDSLGFVINQLTNLGVCNNALFSSYANRRTQSLQLTGERKDKSIWNEVNGVWQIIDLYVDPQIEDRRITNSQISNPNGNLLNVIESFCQKPFVEFFGDTYGDKFTFIARTPPFTRQAILSVLNSGNYIDVNLRDVEEYDLDWDSTFYTWFEMDPRNMFLGRSDSIALAYLPVVYFPEIADSFGNKQMKVTDNYISNQAFTGAGLTENRDLFKQKVIEDFLYVIECYCNLPFTETGNITIKRDRRIRAKTWVKIGSQMFYVDAITNSFMAIGERIDGSTILSVSRGMYIDYIRGKIVEELGREINYWSMVRLDVVRKTLIQKLTLFNTEDSAIAAGVTKPVEASITKNTVQVSFGTDKEAFDYFLQRKFLL